MENIKVMAHIHSLDGEKREVTILKHKGGYNYIVEYNGVKCTAIFNGYTGSYYADDKYGIIKEN